jgi:hypothetical protein
MKLNNKIFIALVAIVALASCKKSFLDKTPVDAIAQEDFYKTPDDAFKALVASYNVLDLTGYGNIVLSSEITSDDCFGGGGLADNGPRQWDKFQDYTNLNSDAWKKYYQGIYRANTLLAQMDNVDFGTTPALKSQYLGETYFLRAYYYFDLVRMFGNVPLLTKPIEGSNYYIPQASSDSVYRLIASDLKQAISLLTPSAVAYSSIKSTDYGRATKWAAEALMARVYLYYTGYYSKPDLMGVFTKQDATAAVEDVIQNSGYGLVDKFANLWRPASQANFAGQNNKEGVFVIQYTDQGKGDWNKQNGNRFQVMVGLRNQALGNYYKGWGIATVNSALYNAYDATDTRKASSIISIDDEHLTYTVGDQYQYTGYFWKKYAPVNDASRPDANGGDFQIDNYDNYVAIRFADVLLMGSELNLTTNLAKAQGYYDQIRDRAYGDALHRKTLTGDAAGLSLVMNERRLELALEGQRYWDLLRQGLDATKQAIDNTTGGTDFNVSFRKETKGLFAIPEAQIGLSNGTLTQNAGWN